MQSAFKIIDLTQGVYQLDFDLPNAPVNVLNNEVYQQLNQALDELEKKQTLTALVFTSSKSVFVAGADIPVLLASAKKSEQQIMDMLSVGHNTFTRIQHFPCVTAACINGFALGGGLELALACDVRVMARQAKLGVPEVNLGLFPGWGGTTRLPRMIAPQEAAKWVCTGAHQSADVAYQTGLVSQVVEEPVELIDAALEQVKYVNIEQIREQKSAPVSLDEQATEAIEQLMVGLQKRPGKDYPAGQKALQSMLSQFHLPLEQANQIELQDFAKLLRSDTAVNLLSVFLNEQAVAKAVKSVAKQGKQTAQSAVIGAGIMGGGIAYQSALKNVPAVMKDINQAALDLGMQEAERNFSALLSKGRMNEQGKQQALARIKPTLDNGDIAGVDTIVEAVVENIKVKKAVLADLENQVAAQTVITSNTSTISITRLAEDLQRPENFCGMHFFNPVPLMPLVEIIRGEKTSEQTIANTVNYALQLGKKPVIVNDCPGFLVNRVLFPYINAAHILIQEGVDFQQLDQVMEQWGWPMGPAYLSDVIGIDTMVHCLDVMAEDIPERMSLSFESANHVMFNAKRLGQKGGQGFYQYTRNQAGRLAKQADPSAYELLYKQTPKQIEANEIEERLMVAICLEMVRCLEENIVATPAEADMALLWGLGFPRFRGGVLRYIDTLGIDAFFALAEKYQDLAALYQIPQLLKDKKAQGKGFY